eukprot:15430988-Alexandrium_andersonii.AAC.1
MLALPPTPVPSASSAGVRPGSEVRGAHLTPAVSEATGYQTPPGMIGEPRLLWRPPPTPVPSSSAPPSVGASTVRPQERPSPPGATRTPSTAHGPAPVARLPRAAPAPRAAVDGSPGGLSLRAWAARRTVEPSAAGG